MQKLDEDPDLEGISEASGDSQGTGSKEDTVQAAGVRVESDGEDSHSEDEVFTSPTTENEMNQSLRNKDDTDSLAIC